MAQLRAQRSAMWQTKSVEKARLQEQYVKKTLHPRSVTCQIHRKHSVLFAQRVCRYRQLRAARTAGQPAAVLALVVAERDRVVKRALQTEGPADCRGNRAHDAWLALRFVPEKVICTKSHLKASLNCCCLCFSPGNTHLCSLLWSEPGRRLRLRGNKDRRLQSMLLARSCKSKQRRNKSPRATPQSNDWCCAWRTDSREGRCGSGARMSLGCIFSRRHMLRCTFYPSPFK